MNIISTEKNSNEPVITTFTDHPLDSNRKKEIFFFLGLFLESTGWKTEKSPVMYRLERLSQHHGISLVKVVETLCSISDMEFRKILYGGVLEEAREDNSERKSFKSDPYNRIQSALTRQDRVSF